MFHDHLNNPFDSKRISSANLTTFAEKHAALLVSFNAPPALLEATSPLIDNFKLQLTDISNQEGKKQAKTVSVDELIDEIKKYISRKGGVITDTFPADSPTYQEFYPVGRGEYTAAAKKNIQVLVERFRDACVNHKAELGEEIGNRMTAYARSLADARKNQITNMSGVKDKSSALESARNQLTKQLFINLLTLILKHIDDTEQVKNYFDTSMFKHATKKNNTEGNATPPTQA